MMSSRKTCARYIYDHVVNSVSWQAAASMHCNRDYRALIIALNQTKKESQSLNRFDQFDDVLLVDWVANDPPKTPEPLHSARPASQKGLLPKEAAIYSLLFIARHSGIVLRWKGDFELKLNLLVASGIRRAVLDKETAERLSWYVPLLSQTGGSGAIARRESFVLELSFAIID